MKAALVEVTQRIRERSAVTRQAYLTRITCPIIFLSPANDFHGRINDLEKAIAEAGIKSLRDLTIEGRVKLLESIGAQFVDENFKGMAGDSVDGLLQSFLSRQMAQ
jgi:hypothetical protein